VRGGGSAELGVEVRRTEERATHLVLRVDSVEVYMGVQFWGFLDSYVM